MLNDHALRDLTHILSLTMTPRTLCQAFNAAGAALTEAYDDHGLLLLRQYVDALSATAEIQQASARAMAAARKDEQKTDAPEILVGKLRIEKADRDKPCRGQRKCPVFIETAQGPVRLLRVDERMTESHPLHSQLAALNGKRVTVQAFLWCNDGALWGYLASASDVVASPAKPKAPASAPQAPAQ